MGRAKRNPRAKNKINSSNEGAVIKVQPEPFPDAPAQVYRSQALTRSHLLSAELEAVIEIIAYDRVYRAMLERRARRLLLAAAPPEEPPKRLEA